MKIKSKYFSIKLLLWFAVFLTEAGLPSLIMDIRVLRVKELPWRISMRQGFLKLMVKWLPSLVFLMVYALAFHFLKFRLSFFFLSQSIKSRVILVFLIEWVLARGVLFRSWRCSDCRISEK